MNNMDKKVLIYCRVSTQQQTTDRQKEELLKFAAENHWNVEEEDIFIDVISGSLIPQHYNLTLFISS